MTEKSNYSLGIEKVQFVLLIEVIVRDLFVI